MVATFKERVTDYLLKHGGKIEADNVTGKLARALRVPDAQRPGLISALKRMEADGLIERSVVGKRTKGIYLIPQPEHAATTNGQEPAPTPTVTKDSGEIDYSELAQEMIRSAAEAFALRDKYREENRVLKKELERLQGQLQAAELQNAALGRQVMDAKEAAKDIQPELKKEVRSLLNKINRMG